MDISISVIIPVYNVEEYLRKCLDSLMNQTYNNFTILLIDDGSTDESGKICDMYKLKFPDRFQVYHKNNGGLSDARNFGVNHSNSDYIIFVDSDDFVDKYFVESFIIALDKYKCDMVVSSLNRIFPDGKLIKSELEDDLVLTTEESLILACYEQKFGNHAVSKLMKYETAKKHPYPLGKIFEDSYTTYKQILDCEKIVCLKQSSYYYFQRNGSIQRRKFNLKHLELVYATFEMVKSFEILNLSDTVVMAGIYKLFRSAHITILHSINTSYYDTVFEICNNILNPYRNKIKDLNLSINEKIIFNFLITNKSLYKLIYKLKKNDRS